jgi:triosephosphate isomerase
MRKKIVAGNWKMNLNYEEAKLLLNTLINSAKSGNTNAEIISVRQQFILPHFQIF